MSYPLNLSIVIVTYKSKKYISRCIESVREATGGLTAEIIIVDNSPEDRLEELIRSEFKEVILIQNDKNNGFARGVNQGVSRASGEFINILNPDTRLKPDTLKILLDFMQKNPQCSLAGARTIYETRKSVSSCRSLPHIANIMKYPISLLLHGKSLKKPRRYLLDIWEQDKTIDVTEYNGYIMGACMVMRADFFKKIGMFDQRFFFTAEDADLGLRIAKAGFHAFFVAEATLVHHEGKSAARNPRSFFLFVDAYMRYIHKNLSFFHGEIYKFFFFFFVFGEALRRFLRMKREESRILLYSLLYLIRYWSVDPPDIINL